MQTLATIQLVIKDAFAVLGTLSVLSTTLSLLPFSTKAKEVFARVGVATSNFTVKRENQ